MFKDIKHATIAVLFLLAFVSLHYTGVANAVFVTSVCRVIYIPIILWGTIGSYTILMHLVSFKSFGGALDSIRKGTMLGFVMHIYIMLFDLVASLIKDHSFISRYYFYYIILISLAVTCGISVASVFSNKGLRKTTSRDNLYQAVFFSPLFALPLYAIGGLMTQPDKAPALLMTVSYLSPYLFMRGRLLPFVTKKVKFAFTFFINNDHNLIIGIFVLAFLARSFFAVNIINKTEGAMTNSFISASDDGDMYDEVGLKIIDGHDRGVGYKVKIWGGRYDDAYGVFLAAVYRVFGRNFYAVTLIQSFFGSLIPVIVFLLGKFIFSRPVGIFAALGMTMKGSMIFLSVVLGHEALWVPLLALFVLIAARYYSSDQGAHLYMIALGVTLGLICVFRGLFIYFIPFVFFWIIFFGRKKTTLKTFTALTIFIISLFIVIQVVSIIFETRLSLGEMGRISALWDSERLYGHFMELGNIRLKEIGIDYTRDISGSIRNIARDPFRFLAVAIKIYPMRMIAYLETFHFGFFDPIYLINSAKWPNSFMPTLEFYFTLFFIYGLILCLGRPYILKSPLFLIILFHIIVFSVIMSNMAPRYRDPITPYLYLIGSYGLVNLLRHLKILKIGLSQ